MLGMIEIVFERKAPKPQHVLKRQLILMIILHVLQLDYLMQPSLSKSVVSDRLLTK